MATRNAEEHAVTVYVKDADTFTYGAGIFKRITTCPKCQHYMDDGVVTWCRKHLHKANASDYCAWAERKAD